MSVQPAAQAFPARLVDRPRQARPADCRGRSPLRCGKPLCRRQYRHAPRAWLPRPRRPGRAGWRGPVAHRARQHAARAGALLQRHRPRARHAYPYRGGRRLALALPEGADRRPAEAGRRRTPAAPDVGRLRLAAGLRHGREGRGRLQGQRPESLRQRRAVGQHLHDRRGRADGGGPDGAAVRRADEFARRVDRRDLGHARHARHGLAQRQARERVRAGRRHRGAPAGRRLASVVPPDLDGRLPADLCRLHRRRRGGARHRRGRRVQAQAGRRRSMPSASSTPSSRRR